MSDTLSMPIPERILLVEETWDSVAAELDVAELSEEEKNLIDERPKAWHRNPSRISVAGRLQADYGRDPDWIRKRVGV